MDQENKYIIRLQVEGGKAVSATLNEMGITGEKVLLNLKEKSSGTEKAMRSLSSTIKATIGAYLLNEFKNTVQGAVRDLADLQKAIADTKFSSEQIQTLRAALGQNGDDTNLAVQALKNFNEQLGAAQTGVGKLLPVLKDYGVSITQGGKFKSNVDVFLDYVEAIKSARTEEQKLFLAQKAFGDEAGEKLLAVLRNGTSGLNEFAAAAANAGLIVDDSITKRAEEIQRSYNRLAYSIKIGAESTVVSIAAFITDALAEINGFIGDVESAYQRLAGKTQSDAVRFLNSDSPHGVNAATLPKNAEDYFSTVLGTRQPDGNAVFAKNGKTTAAAGASGNTLDEDRKRQEAIQKQIEGLRQQNENMERSAELQEVYNELQKNSIDINSAAGQEIKTLVDQHIELVRQQKLSRDLAEDFNNSLIDAAINGGDLNDVISNLGLELERTLLSAATQPLTDAGSSLLQGVFKSFAFAGGGIMSSAGPLPIRKYSGGGIADRPQVAIFGEGDVDEAYVPVPNGKIPVELRGSTSGSVVQPVIQLINASGTPLRAENAGRAPNGDMRVMLKSAVREIVATGGLNEEMRALYGLTPALR